MKRLRAKNVKEFFEELEKYVEFCFKENLPNLNKDELEERGKIYYMNDKDDTIFNVSMNQHLCYFMCFYNNGMGAIKVGVYLDGNIEAYLYKKKENKPFVTEKAKIDCNILDVALALYVGADKRNLFGKSIKEIKIVSSISKLDKKTFYESCGILDIDNETAKRYIESLERRYIECNRKEEWYKFKNNRKSANIKELLNKYPKTPASLLSLLEFSDGTDIYFLGSDVDKGTYPYYLLPVKDMFESEDMIRKNYSDFIDSSVKEFKVDDRITDDLKNVKWIHFADCMNNGGTSQLFIDLTPSNKGVKGQIIRYLHDPDSLEVIANSFDEYLNRQVKMGLKFISENQILESKETKKEEIKQEEQEEIDIKTKPPKLMLLCIGLIIMSFINMIMIFFRDYSNVLTSIVLFIALLGILTLFVYSFIRLLKNRFSKEVFNILLIINMLFSLQYIGNISVLNIVLILINLGLSAYGMNMIEKLK